MEANYLNNDILVLLPYDRCHSTVSSLETQTTIFTMSKSWISQKSQMSQHRPEIGLWRDLREYATMPAEQRRQVPKPKVDCPVCYREFDITKFDNGQPMSQCEGFQELIYSWCGHLVCRDCWKGIIAANSNESVSPVKCPICRTTLTHQECGHRYEYVRVDPSLHRGLVCWGAALPPFSSAWDVASTDFPLAAYPFTAPEVDLRGPIHGCEQCRNKGKTVPWSWHNTSARLWDRLWELKDKTTELKMRWCEKKDYQQAIMRINGIWTQKWPELMCEEDHVLNQAHLSEERRQNYFEKKPVYDRRCARIPVLGLELDELDRQWQEALGEQEAASQNVQDHELARWQPEDRRIDVTVHLSSLDE